MDEDRKSYIKLSIYNMVDATNLVEDLGDFIDKYRVAELFYKAGLLKDDEYDQITSDFKRDDEIFESIVDGTADFEQLHKESVDKVESFLAGGSSATSIDGIIQWINSPDCNSRCLDKLNDAIFNRLNTKVE